MYAIYLLATKELIRTTSEETFIYDAATEGFKVIADSYSGNVTWSPDHLDFKDLLADPTIVISSIDFISRFTLTERLAIHTLASTSPIAKDLLYMLQLVSSVSLVTPNIKMGLDYLVSVAILTVERRNTIRGYS